MLSVGSCGHPLPKDNTVDSNYIVIILYNYIVTHFAMAARTQCQASNNS